MWLANNHQPRRLSTHRNTINGNERLLEDIQNFNQPKKNYSTRKKLTAANRTNPTLCTVRISKVQIKIQLKKINPVRKKLATRILYDLKVDFIPVYVSSSNVLSKGTTVLNN
jgi:hypothetical protein